MRNILIVEDDPILALDFHDLIYETGGRPIGPAHCLQGALELSSSYKIDLALVDIHLTDGPTGLAIARILHERFRIRTVIISGQAPSPNTIANMKHIFVQKPVPKDVLARIFSLPAESQVSAA